MQPTPDTHAPFAPHAARTHRLVAPFPTPVPAPARLVRRIVALALFAGLCASAQALGPAGECPPHDKHVADPSPRQPVVRVALLLDTSNSMDGLIGQAKAQLWSVVNRLAKSKRHGQRPQLQIALYQYGNNSLSEGQRWVQQVLPFTTDLDIVSERLFGLTTNGGQEYCGAVIDRAMKDLSWSRSDADASFVFIAGNEPFNQGDTPYAEPIADAIRKGVRINTIFCGPRQEGVHTKWSDGALLGRGDYMAIEQDRQIDHCPSPYDDEISRLGVEVNDTYLPFGGQGEGFAQRQDAMDGANARLPAGARESATLERAIAKNSIAYTNAHWDLVDALDKKSVKLEDLKEADLPKRLHGLTPEAQRSKIEELTQRRREINTRVAELSRKREEFVAQQRAAGAAGTGGTTLGDALLEAITRQAKEDGFEFD
jgi:uncharacterized protein YdaT